eukprot:CAMPEP_0113587930 /NCGR_PEP_ID=MMETSP0015_2-20120614/35204_1 /TAXON_ID=2838 /ORGANISM="Odontella" /LENGTH=37 /DNA_ID=CAMNT_0000493689 /DNA_START=141 /DNA_END=254 /DNA_ORIENTATION=+ /assembly_acc=CAM_ASM_000160
MTSAIMPSALSAVSTAAAPPPAWWVLMSPAVRLLLLS